MPQWISDIISVSPVLGGFVLIVAVGAVAWKYLRPPTKGLNHFLEDWNGDAERPGVPERPGVMQRLQDIDDSQARTATHQSNNDAMWAKYGPLIDRLDHEMHPNSGSSLADAVNRTEAALKAHIDSCPPAPVVPVTTVNVHTQEHV